MYIPPAITLEVKVIEKLMFEPAVDSSKIQVSCKDSNVILSGSVNSLFEKNVAERAVRSVEGVKEVANKLQVDLAEKYKRDDNDITNAVVNALKWDVAVPEDTIQVNVENGKVTLAGKVDWWYQKESAEKAIRNLIGIKSINNKIAIHPMVTIKEVKNKIMEEFHRNASIDAAKINVEIEGNKIILRGSVRSWPEMKEATRAAWSIPGITEIDNRLVINP